MDLTPTPTVICATCRIVSPPTDHGDGLTTWDCPEHGQACFVLDAGDLDMGGIVNSGESDAKFHAFIDTFRNLAAPADG